MSDKENRNMDIPVNLRTEKWFDEMETECGVRDMLAFWTEMNLSEGLSTSVASSKLGFIEVSHPNAYGAMVNNSIDGDLYRSMVLGYAMRWMCRRGMAMCFDWNSKLYFVAAYSPTWKDLCERSLPHQDMLVCVTRVAVAFNRHLYGTGKRSADEREATRAAAASLD